MSRSKAPLRAVPETAPEEVTLSGDAMDDLDIKLTQIRAIADLVGMVYPDSLLKHTVQTATFCITELVEQCEKLVADRKLVQP